MFATVYYVSLSSDQAKELNESEKGWGSPIGVAYLSAKDGAIDVTNRDLVKPAARGDFANAEDAWVRLQNVTDGWADAGRAESLGERRSMDVGDLIVWEDGRIERCASVGFEPYELAVQVDTLGGEAVR